MSFIKKIFILTALGATSHFSLFASPVIESPDKIAKRTNVIDEELISASNLHDKETVKKILNDLNRKPSPNAFKQSFEMALVTEDLSFIGCFLAKNTQLPESYVEKKFFQYAMNEGEKPEIIYLLQQQLPSLTRARLNREKSNLIINQTETDYIKDFEKELRARQKDLDSRNRKVPC